MARLTPLAQSNDLPPLTSDPLAGDHIGFDAWLLSPVIPDRMERAIRLCSTAAGPLVFALALTGVVGRLL